MSTDEPSAPASQHPVFQELTGCLRAAAPDSGEQLSFPNGLKEMLLDGLRPLVADPDFEPVVRAIAKLALALKQDGSPTASSVLVSVLKDEQIASGIKSVGHWEICRRRGQDGALVCNVYRNPRTGRDSGDQRAPG